MATEITELDASESLSVRDLKLGIRSRKAWGRIVTVFENEDISEGKVRQALSEGYLAVGDAGKAVIAEKVGFDPNAWADAFIKIAPIIMQMMAACA